MTAKRAEWKAWSLTVVAPGVVEVANESYGEAATDHTYCVTVAPDEQDPTLFVPQTCECPADEWREDYDCKHKVALATRGGPVVFGAAMAFTGDEGDAAGRRVRA